MIVKSKFNKEFRVGKLQIEIGDTAVRYVSCTLYFQ